MSKTINTKILIRRDTSSNWSTNNPILAAGEIGFDLTIGKNKIGNGVTHWNDLPYFALVSDVSESTKIVSYSAIVGDGISSTFTITHNLGSLNLLIQCYDIDSISGTLENIIGYYTIINSNTIQIDLSYIPNVNGLKVAIISTDTLANISGGGNFIIDDTAGVGDTDKTWSANKIIEQLNKITDLVDIESEVF